MHPIEVLKLYETSHVEIVGEEIQLEDIEIVCSDEWSDHLKKDVRSSAPFHFMKIHLFIQDTSEDGATLIDLEQDREEELLKLPQEQFFFEIYFWPHDVYNELVEEYEETGEDYWDEGTGDWSRELDYNSPTIERLVKMLQEGEENAKNVSMH